MATNPYFNSTGESTELDMQEDLVIEEIQQSGIDVLYVPRDRINVDTILTEVQYSSFGQGFSIEAKVEGIEEAVRVAFMANTMDMPLFRPQIKVWISKSRFRAEVPDTYLNAPGRPNEGDLIFVPHIKTLLEITSADPDDLMYSGGRLFVYSLKCEFFRSQGESVDSTPARGLADTDQMPQLLLPTKMLNNGIVTDTTGTGQNAAVEGNVVTVPDSV